MRFDQGYKEDVTLSDGTAVRLRCVRPSDKGLLLEGFDRLSPESRYRRFFTEKAGLSEADLRYLTEVDGVRHFALGALCRDEAGRQQGIGVTRFVSLDGEVAEPAVAVIDDMQGKGLGRILFHRLVAAAVERGIQRFSAEVLATNDPMRAILGEVSLDYGRVSDAGVLVIDVPLGALPHDHPHRNPLYQLLRYAAQGMVVARRALSLAVGAEPADGGAGSGGEGDDRAAGSGSERPCEAGSAAARARCSSTSCSARAAPRRRAPPVVLRRRPRPRARRRRSGRQRRRPAPGRRRASPRSPSRWPRRGPGPTGSRARSR
ncbi:MAG: GNAT family N-acetyltransferase [Deltaproteobacteria bacterium]|nr:GNAT family N-acetyltransferase [Deltaproteobacteria bacterium]